LVAAGHTNAQIARWLGISRETVRIHLENIYQRLHVSSRTAAVTRVFPDRLA
jgi:DNA-binding NarL/FixJ family response regulator